MSNEMPAGVEYPHPFDERVIELCDSASRRLYIQSPALDPRVFDNPDLVRALSSLARRSHQNDIRILVSDSRQLVARGHRLLELARRLPSLVHIRRLAEHPSWNEETVVIRDGDGVLYKPGGAEHDGFYEPDSRAAAQRHLELFNDLWRYSVQDIDLRSLSM